MTKITHKVTLPCGAAAKRISASRTYPFCVASRPSYDFALQQASKVSPTDASNYRYYLQVIAEGGRTHMVQWTGEADDAFAARCAKNAADKVASQQGATSAAEYQTLKVAERIAFVEARKAAGYYDAWVVQGWQSRADLAQKELIKVSSNVWLGVAEAKIIPVTDIVTK
jgi:hypothetical protein